MTAETYDRLTFAVLLIACAVFVGIWFAV